MVYTYIYIYIHIYIHTYIHIHIKIIINHHKRPFSGWSRATIFWPLPMRLPGGVSDFRSAGDGHAAQRGWSILSQISSPWCWNMHSYHLVMHGSLNVPIEHHPTIRYMVYNGYYKVMSNIPKMGQLPTPVMTNSSPWKDPPCY